MRSTLNYLFGFLMLMNIALLVYINVNDINARHRLHTFPMVSVADTGLALVDCEQLYKNQKAFCYTTWPTDTLRQNTCLNCAASSFQSCTGTHPGDFCSCLKAAHMAECDAFQDPQLRAYCRVAWDIIGANCALITDAKPANMVPGFTPADSAIPGHNEPVPELSVAP